jgi:hypothetical protein
MRLPNSRDPEGGGVYNFMLLQESRNTTTTRSHPSDQYNIVDKHENITRKRGARDVFFCGSGCGVIIIETY